MSNSPTQAQSALAQWRIPLALLLASLVWLLAWYFDTAWSIVSTWERNETFAHGYLIVPISLYLIWTRRAELTPMTPRSDWWPVGLLAAAGLGWLLAELAGVVVIRQYALVAMLVLTITAVLGRRVGWALAFPLAFLFFGVPVGDALLPSLMKHTADFTVTALQISGIPVYREGLYFMIPSGNWSVVEACSGLRYLIASITLGCLYAYLTYRSAHKRAIFIALSAVVPIFANWVRAYMIVMIGHLSGMKLAVGVDHLIYGWVFFGLVMLVLFWIGSRWREDLDAPVVMAGTHAAPSSEAPLKPALVALACAAITTIWPVWAQSLVRGFAPNDRPEPALLATGWTSETRALTEWTPQFAYTPHHRRQEFRRGTQSAGLDIHRYPARLRTAEVISSQNMLVAPSNKDGWGVAGEGAATVVTARGPLTVRETRIRVGTRYLLAWSWYWVGGTYTTSGIRGKLAQGWAKLTGGQSDGAIVVLYAPYTEHVEDARKALEDFAPAVLPSLQRYLPLRP